jgi:hypothetical protein
MRGWATVVALALACRTSGEESGIKLSHGVITYVANDGHRAKVAVGGACADLWVSPDQSIIAFIAIDKMGPTTTQSSEPFIEQSTVYIARRLDGFAPLRVVAQIRTDGRVWRVARQPSVSPDLRTIYFSVPYTMTTWKLMRGSIPPTSFETIGDADGYCVIWGGKHSGELLMQSRRESGQLRPRGAEYPCYLRSKEGTLTNVATEDACWAFDEFAERWSGERGGACGRGVLGTH